MADIEGTELKNWKQRLNVSHRRHEELKLKNDTYKKYYRGEQWLDTVRAARYIDHVVDNVIFSNIRIIAPSLSFRNPKIFVTPKQREHFLKGSVRLDTAGSAQSMELLLNYYFKELDIKRETRKCLYDALLTHWAIIDIGYTMKTEKIKSKDELLIVDELIRSESVFAKRRSPDDFRVDIEGTDLLLNDRRWIALKWIKELEDVKADPKYKNTKDLKPNFRVNTTFGASAPVMSEYRTTGEPDLWDRVVGWTLWDKKTRMRYEVVDTHNKFLLKESWPKWTDAIEGFPVEVLYMNENPDEAFPLPDIEIYRRAQDEINQMGSLMLSHIKRVSERRYVTGEDTMSQEEDDKLRIGGDGSVIKVKGGNAVDKIVPLQDAGISQDIYLFKRMRKQEISEMAGVANFEKGSRENFDTAAEPQLMNQGIQTIRDDQRAMFENFIVRIARKIATVIQQTMESKEIPLTKEQFQQLERQLEQEAPQTAQTQSFIRSKLAKIVGEEGQISLQPWLKLSKDDIQAEYEFDIEVGSTAPINQDKRKSDALVLSQALQGNPYIREREGTIKFLEAFEVKNIDDLIKSDEEVQAAQEQQAQMAQQPTPDQMVKTQADMQKTTMKTESAERIAGMKNKSNMLSTVIKETSK